MNKFLAGLVLGTLLGFVFAQAVRDKDIGPATTIATQPLGSSVGDERTSATAGIESSASAGQSRRFPETTPSGSGPPKIEAPRPAASVPSDPVTARGSTTRDAGSSAVAQPRTPIAVPDAIRPFLEKTDTHDGLTLGQMHTKLEEEPDDLAWSYQMEMYLQQSLARPTKSGQPLDIRIIECRTTLCEIIGFSPLPNPSDDISALVQHMSQQPWWDFDNFNMTAEGAENGGKFLLFLRRKPH